MQAKEVSDRKQWRIISLVFCFRYGVGYHLTLVKGESCNQNALTSLILNHVPSAQLLSSVGAEIEFLLSSEHGSAFESLFQEIESKLITTKQ